MDVPDLEVRKQLFVGDGETKALGEGEAAIRGTAYIEGPLQVGKDNSFSEVKATVMIGPENNTDSDTHPSDSLMVEGDMTVNNGNIHTTNLLACTGQGVALSGSTINVQGWKGFDIKHPNKEKYRLRHVCVEGPEAAVYCRGRVKNSKEIVLPSYWDGLVDIDSITVQLTPIGAHQDVIVKRWDDKKIYLQPQGGMPIDCFYYIMASRIDGEELIVEYAGETPADYPGDPAQFSISGYDYGRGVDKSK
jgi:hypothetical protein|tara:strand:- start:6 stop:749 length:744 start_codon:yes stop_codon:yes gene_type:complete